MKFLLASGKFLRNDKRNQQMSGNTAILLRYDSITNLQHYDITVTLQHYDSNVYLHYDSTANTSPVVVNIFTSDKTNNIAVSSDNTQQLIIQLTLLT